MQFSSIAVIFAFVIKVQCDYNAWSTTCCTGVEGGGCWTDSSVSTDAQSHCGGCSWGRNPCNCGEAWEYRLAPDGNYGLHAPWGNIGWCQKDTRWSGACNAWNYSCYARQTFRCITANCGPHKKRSEGFIEAPAVQEGANEAKTVDGYTEWEGPEGKVQWKLLEDGNVEWKVGDKVTIRPVDNKAPEGIANLGVPLEKRGSCFK